MPGLDTKPGVSISALAARAKNGITFDLRAASAARPGMPEGRNLENRLITARRVARLAHDHTSLDLLFVRAYCAGVERAGAWPASCQGRLSAA